MSFEYVSLNIKEEPSLDILDCHQPMDLDEPANQTCGINTVTAGLVKIKEEILVTTFKHIYNNNMFLENTIPSIPG